MLVGVVPKGTRDDAILLQLEEVESLVKTYGGQIFAATVQKSNYPDKSTFVGSGKAQEIADTVAKDRIDIVVINDIVKPGQLYTLEKIFFRSNPNIKVWDRVNLILQIFSLHAHTKEAKLQIDLAALRHMGPRIFGMGYILSRQGGGIGTVGIGETNTELMKRHYRDQMNDISRQLKRLGDEKIKQIEKRKSLGFRTAALVGYTNAGKTMLYNGLTNKSNYVKDVLFATLDSSAGKMQQSNQKGNIIVTDTIGFIRNLPPSLIDAFKSTLLESVHADLLLIVADISDPEIDLKLRVVDDVLKELLLLNTKRLYVFNKIDKDASGIQKELIKQYTHLSPLFVSAKTGQGVDILRNKISQSLRF